MTKKDSAAAAHRKPVEHATHAQPPAKISDDESTSRPPASGAAAAAAAAAGKRRRVAVVMATVGVVAVVACTAIGVYMATTSSSSSGSAGQQNATLTGGTATTTTTAASLTNAAPRPAPLQQAVTIAPISVSSSTIGRADGRPVIKYVMSNGRGVQVDLISIGARINALRVPVSGGAVDIVAGLNEANVTNFQRSYLGAVNGRVCCAVSPIISYNSQQFTLRTADSIYKNGGSDGFYTKNYYSYVDAQNNVHFLYNSSASADGVPGSVWVHATYQLTADSELIVTMTLNTDTLSPVDMCSSVGFNLCGANKGSLTDNKLQLFTTTTAVSLDGKEVTVSSAASFQSESDMYTQVKNTREFASSDYDHAFRVGNKPSSRVLLARAKCASNNVAVELYSNQPSIRVFTTSSGEPVDGKYGMNYTGTSYFFLQPQQYPPVSVSGKAADYSNLMLTPESQYRQETSFKLNF